MRPKVLRSISFLLIILAASLLNTVAADWPSIAPEDKAMTSVAKQPGAPGVILYREDSADDPKNFRTVYVRLKVLTEAGLKYKDVEIPVGRKPFTITQFSARTVHPDGQVTLFGGEATDRLVLHDHGMLARAKVFTLPSVEVGSILDYRYTLHYPEGSRNAPEWMVQTDLFQKKVVFKFVPTRYQPKTDSLRVDSNSYAFIGIDPFEPINSEEASINHLPSGQSPEDHIIPFVLYKWIGFEMNDVPAALSEPDIPPAGVMNWRVEFFYRVNLNPDAYWKSVGKVWDNNIESSLEKKNGIAETVGELTTAADTPETKVRKLYAYVSAMENQTFAPVAAAPSSAAPGRGAESILQSRSGTHDELNRVFVAMVRAAGVPAMMMWVPDRGRAAFDVNLMSVDQLDAEVAVVRLDGKEVFLDPGTKFCPFGQLAWHYAGSRGLRQTGGGSTVLADTPAPTYKDALIQRVALLHLSAKGNMEGSLAVGFSGQEAMVRRQRAATMSADERNELLQAEVASWLPRGNQLTLTNAPEWDKTEDVLVGKFSVTGPLAINKGQGWVVPLNVFAGAAKSPFTSAQRVSPVQFDYASRQVDEMHISSPADVEWAIVPSSRHVKTGYSVYTSECKREGANGIVCTRVVAMNTVLLSPNEYKDLKDFFDKVAAGDSETAALKGSL